MSVSRARPRDRCPLAGAQTSVPELAEQPYVITRLVDASESRAEIRLHVRRSTGRAAGVAGALQLAGLVDSVSDSAAVETLLRYPVKIVREGSGAPGSDQNRRGVLIFSTTELEQYAIIELPGIKPELVDPANESQLLMTSPALAAYITALLAGGFCNPFGYELVSCIAALHQVRQN